MIVYVLLKERYESSILKKHSNENKYLRLKYSSALSDLMNFSRSLKHKKNV